MSATDTIRDDRIRCGGGIKAGPLLFGDGVGNTDRAPDVDAGVAVMVASLSFVVLNQANPHDTGWILFVCVLSFVGSRLGATWMGIEMGAFLGAILVGVASGFFSRARNRPALVTSTPVIYSSPVMGFRSITELISDDPVRGLQTAFTMIPQWSRGSWCRADAC
jgi:hypothetical protein